jgi:AraC-like DNA-binding protein
MDLLADILSVTRLGHTLLNQSELLPPFGLEIASTFKAAVHVVHRGACWVRIDGERRPTRLAAGDVVLVPRGIRHVLADEPDRAAEPYERALLRMRRRFEPGRACESDQSVMLLCAEYEFEKDSPHPLLASLPKMIHLRGDTARKDPSIERLVELLLTEAKQRRSGADLVVPRLVDTLLVFIVRTWLSMQPKDTGGWLGALRDPTVGRALSLIHEAPERSWTVELLAKQVGQSRAAFARKFVELVGEPPLAYVTRRRIDLAASLLRSGDETAERIAELVGYASPAAFGKAFRRHMQVSPGAYRNRRRFADPASRVETSLDETG